MMTAHFLQACTPGEECLLRHGLATDTISVVVASRWGGSGEKSPFVKGLYFHLQ